MDLQHPDITATMSTGYPRDQQPQQTLAWGANHIIDDAAFPYEPDEE